MSKDRLKTASQPLSMRRSEGSLETELLSEY
jgi:hypothetical protein